MASQPEWISISDAHDALALRYFEHVDAEWTGAYNAAFKSIRPKLIDGQLPSRPKSGAAFALTLIGADGRISKRIGLADGRIPALFWDFFAEAEEASRGRLVTLPTENHAAIVGDRFEFHCTGLIDGQTMDGFVEGVEVLKSAIPEGAPPKCSSTKRGRRPYDDSVPVARVIARLETEKGLKLGAAIARVAPMMEGSNTELAGLKRRLREKVCAEMRRRNMPG